MDSLVAVAIGDLGIVGFEQSNPRYVPALLTIGAYGFAGGTAVHAISRGHRVLGCTVLVVTLVAFAVVLHIGSGR